MVKKVSKLPFSGTPEQAARLEAVIASHRDGPGQLMTVMQQAQGIYGYLPYEVQVMIADGMDVPLQRVYGLSTFYAQFTLSPAGKYAVSVCMGTACYVKGAQAVLDHLQELLGIGPGECTADGLFSLEPCRCIGACGLAPVMTVGEEVYGNLTPDMLDDILAKYRDRG
jgi:NADH:ubiquinone oxidoreductase subunit E